MAWFVDSFGACLHAISFFARLGNVGPRSTMQRLFAFWHAAQARANFSEDTFYIGEVQAGTFHGAVCMMCCHACGIYSLTGTQVNMVRHVWSVLELSARVCV